MPSSAQSELTRCQMFSDDDRAAVSGKPRRSLIVSGSPTPTRVSRNSRRSPMLLPYRVCTAPTTPASRAPAASRPPPPMLLPYRVCANAHDAGWSGAGGVPAASGLPYVLPYRVCVSRSRLTAGL